MGTGTTAGHFARSHEYLIIYAKNKELLPNFAVSEEGLISHGALKKISCKNPPSIIEFPAGVDFQGKDAIFDGVIGGSETQKIIDGKMVFEAGKLKYSVKIEAGWAINVLSADSASRKSLPRTPSSNWFISRCSSETSWSR